MGILRYRYRLCIVLGTVRENFATEGVYETGEQVIMQQWRLIWKPPVCVSVGFSEGNLSAWCADKN